jgi:hypothetical protein
MKKPRPTAISAQSLEISAKAKVRVVVVILDHPRDRQLLIGHQP